MPSRLINIAQSGLGQLLAGFPLQTPLKARQRLVYWSVILLISLLIVLCSWYLRTIPAYLEQQIQTRLAHHPQLVELITVSGRDVSIRGELEAVPGLEQDLASLRATPGIRRLTDQLNVTTLPSAELRLSLDGGRLSLAGRLNGNDLDLLIKTLRQGFTSQGLRDRIRIDDRLGRLPWLDQLLPILMPLGLLDQFELYGWRQTLLLDATANSANELRELRYQFPAALDPLVETHFQLRIKPDPDSARLSLISGWNGASLQAVMPTTNSAAGLKSAVDELVQNPISDQSVVLDNSIHDPEWLYQLPRLISGLGPVHDLRLSSSGAGLSIWGRVDSPKVLGEIQSLIEQTGLSSILDSHLLVDPASRKPEISLFRDPHRLVVSGRLPSQGARSALLENLRSGLSVSAVDDLISVEPNIAFSPWLERWPALLPVIPSSAFGLSLAEGNVLVTGQVDSADQYQALLLGIGSMWPDMNLIDWLTVAEDD